MAYCKRWTGRTKKMNIADCETQIGRAKSIWEWPILRGGQGEQNKWKGPIVEGGLGEQKNNENDLLWKVDWENMMVILNMYMYWQAVKFCYHSIDMLD
jgi:hypothetical protein